MREQALNWRGVPSGDRLLMSLMSVSTQTSSSTLLSTMPPSAIHPTSLLWQSNTLLLCHSLCLQGSLLWHYFVLYCKRKKSTPLLQTLLKCMYNVHKRRCGFRLISFQRIKGQSCCYKQAYYPLFVHYHPLHGTASFPHGTKCVQVKKRRV